MIGRLFLRGLVGGDLEAWVVAESVAVGIENLFAAGERFRVVALQFHDANGGVHIGHVALVACLGDIIPPVAGLSLGERILALSVQ